MTTFKTTKNSTFQGYFSSILEKIVNIKCYKNKNLQMNHSLFRKIAPKIYQNINILGFKAKGNRFIKT